MSSLYGGQGAGTGQPNRMGATGNKIPQGYQKGSLQQFNPQQMQLFEQLIGMLGEGGFLSQLSQGKEGAFDQAEAPALRQFSELQGNLASRFSGQGTGGRHSSGFQNASTSAASNFAQDLQGKRMDLQRQAMMDLMGIGNNLLGQRPQENFLVKKKGNWLQELLSAGAGAASGGASGYAAGGWPGAALGAISGGAGAYGGQ